MPPIDELRILIPVDISASDPPALAVLDVLRPFEVVLLGYFPVPDQAEPALLKHEYEDQARETLDEIADGRSDVATVLVFTHDREASIDRIADEYACDAVLTTGDTDHIDRILVPVRGDVNVDRIVSVVHIDRILVPVRGDVNVDRIVSVVAGLLDEGDATVTFFHSVGDHGEPSQVEFLLRGMVEKLTAYGFEEDRIDWTISEEGNPQSEIVTRGRTFDIVVFGETEPSLRERIIGDTLSAVIDRLEVPALVVRDIE